MVDINLAMGCRLLGLREHVPVEATDEVVIRGITGRVNLNERPFKGSTSRFSVEQASRHKASREIGRE